MDYATRAPLSDQIRESIRFMVYRCQNLEDNCATLTDLCGSMEEAEDREYAAEEAISCLEWLIQVIEDDWWPDLPKEFRKDLQFAMDRAKSLVRCQQEDLGSKKLGEQYRDTVRLLTDALPVLTTHAKLFDRARALLGAQSEKKQATGKASKNNPG